MTGMIGTNSTLFRLKEGVSQVRSALFLGPLLGLSGMKKPGAGPGFIVGACHAISA